MPSHQIPSITIIGGGLAAPVLALCLKKNGISSVIYEARPESHEHGGHITLSPNANRVLDHVGVYEAICEQGFSYEYLTFTNGKGAVLARLLNGSEKDYGIKALRVRRSIVRKELLRKVSDQGLKINYDHRCVSIERKETARADSVMLVSFANGLVLETDLIIGADGINSHVRQFIDNSCVPQFTGQVGIVGTTRNSGLISGRERQFPWIMYGQNGDFGIMPADSNGEELSFFGTLNLPDRSRMEWNELDADKGRLSEMMKDQYCNPHWSDLVQELCSKTETSNYKSWPFYILPPLKSYMDEHCQVVLIGDAAHTIPPTSGQGAAMAFEDAESLAHVISRSTETSKPDGAVLRLWERHRMGRMNAVTAFTDRSSQLRSPSPGLIAQKLKELVMWTLFKCIGPMARMQWLYGYDANTAVSAMQK